MDELEMYDPYYVDCQGDDMNSQEIWINEEEEYIDNKNKEIYYESL